MLWPHNNNVLALRKQSLLKQDKLTSFYSVEDLRQKTANRRDLGRLIQWWQIRWDSSWPRIAKIRALGRFANLVPAYTRFSLRSNQSRLRRAQTVFGQFWPKVPSTSVPLEIKFNKCDIFVRFSNTVISYISSWTKIQFICNKKHPFSPKK